MGRGRVREGGEEREVTGESGSEREREWYFLFKWLWGPDDQIMEIETPRPESPGQWPEYPGVTILPPKRNLVPRFRVKVPI